MNPIGNRMATVSPSRVSTVSSCFKWWFLWGRSRVLTPRLSRLGRCWREIRALRRGHVGRKLRFQVFEGVEPPLVAKPGQEHETHGATVEIAVIAREVRLQAGLLAP